MKWIILLAAVGGFYWAANWSYHLLDNAFLVTHYEIATGDVGKWGLVNFQNGKSQLYSFTSLVGFWGVFKGLRPVFSMFFIGFFVLIPVVIYISNSLTKLQITNASEAQRIAEERARNATKEAEQHEIKMNRWADEKVRNAQAEARSKAKTELILQIQKLQADQLDLQEREATISAREQAAQEAEISAQQKVDQVVELYEQELARFEAEISSMQSSKNNAQQAFKRIKQKTVKEF
jgi:hypothetical protein